MSILIGRQSNSDDNEDKIIRDGGRLRLKACSTDLIEFLKIFLRVFDDNLNLSKT